MRRAGGIGEDHRAPFADRAEAEDVVVLADGRDGVDQLLAEVPARDQLERLAPRLELPDPGGVGAEQLLRGIEDVLEHRIELERAVDLRHDPAKGDRPCLLGVAVGSPGRVGPRSIRGRVVLAVGVVPPRRTAPAVRRTVVQGERHATGRGYPLREPCAFPVHRG